MKQDYDDFDLRILNALQRDSSLSQREVADAVGLSQNACWRRLKRLQDEGMIREHHARIDLPRLGLDLMVLVLIRTRHHSLEWADSFRRHVEGLPEVIDFHRIGGDWDYLLKVVTPGMAGYDSFYQRLITGFDFVSVQGNFAMETILDNRPVDLMRIAPRQGGHP